MTNMRNCCVKMRMMCMNKNNPEILFPVHPQPYTDELLSSYLYRLGHANMVSPFSILQQAWKSHGGKGRGFFSPNEFMIKNLMEMAKISVPGFKDMSMHGYVPLNNDLKTSEMERLIQFFWSPNRIVRVCPLCLEEAPYYRTLWKLGFVFACVKHKVLLSSKCDSCGQLIYEYDPIRNHKSGLGYCSNCNAKFSKLKAISLENSPEIILIQKKIIELIEGKKSYLKISKELCVSRIEFFTILMEINKFLKIIEPKSELANEIRPHYLSERDMTALFRTVRKTICIPAAPKLAGNINLDCVNSILAFHILENWPYNFFKFLACLQKDKMVKPTFFLGLSCRMKKWLTKESPNFIRDEFYWLRKLLHDIKILSINRKKRTRLFDYLDLICGLYELRKANLKMPLNIPEEQWDKLKEFFVLKKTIKRIKMKYHSERIIRANKIFCVSYLFRIQTKCSWWETPAVKKKLICGSALFARERYLKNHGCLKQVIHRLLKIAKNFKITKKNPFYLPDNYWEQVKNSFPKIKTQMRNWHYKKTEESYRMFCSAYLLRMINACRWRNQRNVPVTSKELIPYRTFEDTLRLLKKRDNLYQFTLSLIKVGQKMR